MQIYKTTNNITGDFYIGLNETCNKNYLGSGTNLKKQVDEYGKNNFTKIILCELLKDTDTKLLMAIENLYITRYISDKKCINISIGYKKKNHNIVVKYVDRIKIVKEVEIVEVNKKPKITRRLAELLQLN
tara:strand:- start:220 stop:609 length:390 start_codon:yes stop_codon:yes gene_type:complete